MYYLFNKYLTKLAKIGVSMSDMVDYYDTWKNTQKGLEYEEAAKKEVIIENTPGKLNGPIMTDKNHLTYPVTDKEIPGDNQL